MLSFLYTENYKNLKFDGKVDLKNLNIFIGPNGSGKSNLISYLKFLNQCFIGDSNNSKKISRFEFATSQLNRVLDIDFSPPAKVRLVYGLSQKTDSLNSLVLDLGLYITQSLGNRITNAREFLYQGTDLEENLHNPLFYYKIHEPEIGMGFEDSDNDEIYLLKDVPNNILWLQDSLPKLTPFDVLIDNFASDPRLDTVSSILDWTFYNANDMNLEIIRTSEPKIGPRDNWLSTTGDNLALVVDNLSQDLDFEDALNLAMKSIFPKTRRIRAVRVGRLSLTIEWHIEGNNESFYLNEMSDGTVRMLCWAVILHSPKLPSLLVIDEPELGLHPAWLSVLAQWIKQASEKTQIILTTHSPDLLDKFTDRLENVYCFYPTDANHYGLKPLSPEVLKPQLEEGWELGDLYRVGEPTVGGWPW
jgi:energy-coupling factor transporter ATP-binding protein EcfA2